MNLVIGLLILQNSHSGADTVELANGDRISGKLQSLDRSECIINTDFQAELRIPLKRITGLQTDHTVAVKLKSGERIDGWVRIQFKQGSLQVRSERLGSIKLNIEELESLSTPTRATAPAKETDEKMLGSLQGKGKEDQPRSVGADAPGKVGAEQAEQQEEEEVQQIFLRASGVLLEPGDQQYEISLNYAREEAGQLLLLSASPLANFRVRTFLMPLIGRVGLFPDLEGFLAVPLQYQERAIGFEESSKFGIGDVQAGLKYAIYREDSLPEMIGTFDFRAPTGSVQNPTLLISNSIGRGQWAVAGGVNLIKSFDPVILFGGLRYEYDIFDQRSGIKFGPWSNLGYNLGLGFAVNHRVTLVGQFQGSYLSEQSFSGNNINRASEGIPDGAVFRERELATLRGGFTYKIAPKQYIEPSITFGINDISPDFIIGLSYNKRL